MLIPPPHLPASCRTINESSPFAREDRHTAAKFIQQSSCRVEGFDWRGVGEIAGYRIARENLAGGNQCKVIYASAAITTA
jgi:hypothetical protein